MSEQLTVEDCVRAINADTKQGMFIDEAIRATLRTVLAISECGRREAHILRQRVSELERQLAEKQALLADRDDDAKGQSWMERQQQVTIRFASTKQEEMASETTGKENQMFTSLMTAEKDVKDRNFNDIWQEAGYTSESSITKKQALQLAEQLAEVAEVYGRMPKRLRGELAKAKRPGMVATSPTEAGWYWRVNADTKDLEVVQVCQDLLGNMYTQSNDSDGTLVIDVKLQGSYWSARPIEPDPMPEGGE